MQDFWNLQFQFSRVIPDFDGMVRRMAEDSAQFAAGRHFERTAYGPHARQWVEWTAGEGATDIVPVIIHGGYWRALTAEDHRFMMQPWLGVGAHVGNIEYRLMPDVRLAQIVDDARRGLAALVDAFPGSRLLIIGHSAGAHLGVSALEDPALAENVAGVIALSGVYDLRPVALSFLQAELALTDAEIVQHSLAAEDGRPPVLYVNGSAETHEFLRGSALMASRGRAGWHLIEDADHMSLTWAAGQAAPELLETLMQMETSE